LKSEKKKLKIIPLGGLEEIGMNITAFEYGDSIIVVDCGLSFPSEDMPGIDLVIPDVSYLTDNLSKVKAFFITHGHEDHIGALPYVLKNIPVSVYGTRLSIGLIERKLVENPVPDVCKRRIVKYGQSVQAGDFRVEFIKVNHSIVDAAALAIFTPVGTVVHTGDFKIDYTPVYGGSADLSRFAELGKKGVLAMLCDSTNIFREGFTMSERTVGKTMDHIFMSHQDSRLIVATFASNVDRVQQIINTANKYGRKVVVDGRSMVSTISTAQELGCIDIPNGCLIDIERLRDYPKEKTVLITTGSQGESMAALSRMATNIHRKVTIEPGDTIILSSTPIPGNEKAVSKVMNELSLLGANVIFQDTHVSGHACQEEIKLMYSLVKPKYSIPVHGEYRHRLAHASMVQEMGWDKANTIMLNSGDVLELDENHAAITGKVQAGKIMVDGLGVGDVGNIVLRDRQTLAQHGIIIVTAVTENSTGELISGPEIITRGFVYVKESEELIEDCRQIIIGTFNSCRLRKIRDKVKLRTCIREELSDYIWKRMKRDPMILPIIMEV
jgi:ribonuclease J